jgi:hypothetical protein
VNGLAALSSGVHILNVLHVRSGADDFVDRSQEMFARCRFGARWLARKTAGWFVHCSFPGTDRSVPPKERGVLPQILGTGRGFGGPVQDFVGRLGE